MLRVVQRSCTIPVRGSVRGSAFGGERLPTGRRALNTRVRFGGGGFGPLGPRAMLLPYLPQLSARRVVLASASPRRQELLKMLVRASVSSRPPSPSLT